MEVYWELIWIIDKICIIFTKTSNYPGDIMILSFTVENFRSIREPVTIDFTATKRLDESELPDNTSRVNDTEILNSIIIYGRNASGKSNILKALEALKYLVENSDKYKPGQKIGYYQPFLFDEKKRTESCLFEIEFLGPETGFKYIYRIEFSSSEILSESLFFYPQNVLARLFERKGKKVEYGEYYKGAKKIIADNLLENQLFLSKASTNRVSYLDEVYFFFSEKLDIVTTQDFESNNKFIKILKKYLFVDKLTKGNLVRLIKAGDTNISDIRIEEEKIEVKPPKTVLEEVINDFKVDNKFHLGLEHSYFDNGARTGERYLGIEDESAGTKKLFITGTLILRVLQDGGVIVIDELDKSLHPLLTRMLIQLFHSKKNNPNNAQLIFATHDSSLLDNEIFRRDQICFVDKEYEGNSIFYKLSDIKGVRKNTPIEEYYLSGRFNAIPVLNKVELDFE